MARKRRKVLEAREREGSDTQKVTREAGTEDVAKMAQFREVSQKIITRLSCQVAQLCSHSGTKLTKVHFSSSPQVANMPSQFSPKAANMLALSSQLKVNPLMQGVPADTDSKCEQQEHFQTFAERLRAKSARECVWDVKKLQRHHLYLDDGHHVLDARDQCGTIRFRPRSSDWKGHRQI